jgi:two-component system chemotaxis sensor kinase CheA
LDKARKGDIVLTGPYIDVTFDSLDMLKTMINNVQGCLDGASYKSPSGLNKLVDHLVKLEEGKIEKPSVESGTKSKKVGEILVESGVSTDSVDQAIQLQKQGDSRTVGEILVDSGEVKPREIAKALRQQVSTSGQPAASHDIDSTIKVSTKRLDNLIDMVGELVIANSMVTQEEDIRMSENHKLNQNINQLGKITRELQELSMSLRMISLKSTFQKMARLVRDLAKKKDKNIHFEMEGEDTELDRTVVEEIGDPLMHMVRNSVDHGIEDTDERRQTNKPPRGLVRLKAFHQGGNVVIQLQDDGKGLNKDGILKKAVKMGIAKEGDEYTDKEIYNMIFNPGLSTAKKVSDISGRGVGMDVVKKNIEKLRGNVEIDSEFGKGTVFTIRLPLTLAIIDGLVVKVGISTFIVPTVSVVESVRPDEKRINSVKNQGLVINLRGNLLPLYKVGDIFGIPGTKEDITESLAIIIATAEKRAAFIVDELIGQQQVVIKNLGESLGNLDGISGGAILGDGHVRLILDPSGIIKVAESM